MAKFNLSDYEKAIQSYATSKECSITSALNRFMYNLALMKDFYPDFGKDLNFHLLGQQWNIMTSTERLKQKKEVHDSLTKYAKSRGIEV